MYTKKLRKEYYKRTAKVEQHYENLNRFISWLTNIVDNMRDHALEKIDAWYYINNKERSKNKKGGKKNIGR